MQHHFSQSLNARNCPIMLYKNAMEVFSARNIHNFRCILLDMGFDDIDCRILDVLQQDGRISNQDLADKVGLSPSPCLRRMKLLETSGIISKYVALVDPVVAGLGLQAIVEVRLDHQTSASIATFEREILKFPHVLECYLMAGDWDYILRVVAADLDDFRDFCVDSLAKISGVSNVKSNICMKQVKFSTALPLT